MFNVIAHSDAASVLSSPEVSISWLGIFLAVVAAMAIGSIWYGPLFGKKWMKIVNHKKGSDSPVGPMIGMLALAIIQAFVLAHFIKYVGYFYSDYSDLSVGALTAAWLFIGFVVPVLVSLTLFEKRSKDLLYINLGNQFVTLLAIGLILSSVN